MTPEQEEHLLDIIHNFTVNCEIKYRRGQNEHDGNLWDKTEVDLVTEALNEAIDQVVYLVTLKRKLLK